jgi:RimJ/RimL family protein N-acetyltransferase
MLHELTDGTRVLIRPVQPGDKPRLAAAVARLSAQSARLRFMAAKPSLSNAELRYLTEIDGSDHLALVAVLADDPDRVVGVARCVRVAPGADTAEFAIVVGDPLQGLGLGTVLTEALGEAAAHAGIRRFSATTLAENVAVERLIEHVAEHVERRPAAGGVRELLADLPGAA